MWIKHSKGVELPQSLRLWSWYLDGPLRESGSISPIFLIEREREREIEVQRKYKTEMEEILVKKKNEREKHKEREIEM